MSAYMVSNRQLTILAAYAVEHCLSAVPYRLRIDIDRSLTVVISRVFDLLASENHRSVCARYSEAELDISEVATFEPKHMPEAFTLPAVHIIKACHNYAYQACEHDGWKESEAKKLIAAIEQEAILRLPGYDDAPWGL